MAFETLRNWVVGANELERLGDFRELYERIAEMSGDQKDALFAWCEKLSSRDKDADMQRLLKHRAQSDEHYRSSRYDPTVAVVTATILCEEADHYKEKYAAEYEKLKASGLLERVAQRERAALLESSKYASGSIVTAVMGSAVIDDPVDFAAHEHAQANFCQHRMETAPFPFNRRCNQ